MPRGLFDIDWRSPRPGGPREIYARDPHLHGSAQWADAAHLISRGYGPGGHVPLGWLPADDAAAGATELSYDGRRHLMTIAPTRAGKSVAVCVPALMHHQGSTVVIDAKDAELATITARYRRDILGQSLVLFDPCDLVASAHDEAPSAINPLDLVDLEGDDPFDAAFEIANALSVPIKNMDSFWNTEATALITGIILGVAAERGRISLVEDGIMQHRADLGRVRDILSLDYEALNAWLETCQASPHALVRNMASRFLGKADRERSAVLSTAHSQTHFLESDRLRASLAKTTIDLQAIGEQCSIYIVLPFDKHGVASRWVRLLVVSLLKAITRLEVKPSQPVYFLLEEMAALGKLDAVEKAYGLMAGYGIQLHAIIQDLSQLKDIYGERWQTFPANAGTIQTFGTNDVFTADYISKLCGMESVELLSRDTSEVRASVSGDPSYFTAADQVVGRPLIRPEEMMSLHPAVQIIKPANAWPILGFKDVYYLEARYRDRRGRPLFSVHPDHQDKSLPRPVDFAKAGLDLGALLDQHIKVG
ncbi:MAG: type IV secretory system conjugative DNA transfer family protein [Pseudomonadota bacterium]